MYDSSVLGQGVEDEEGRVDETLNARIDAISPLCVAGVVHEIPSCRSEEEKTSGLNEDSSTRIEHDNPEPSS